LLIVTPLLEGQTLHPDVVSSVARTGLHWLVVSSKANFDRYHREFAINYTRDLAQSCVARLHSHHSSVLLLDSDVVLPDGAIEAMDSALGGLVAACVRTKQPEYKEAHTIAACALMRMDRYLSVRYMDHPYICQCLNLAQFGRVEYVEGICGHEVSR